MNIKTRLTILSFLQFFIWGSWLISVFHYLTSIGFKPFEAASVFTTFGIASLFMPALLGIIADRWINAEKLFSIAHFLGAICLISVAFIKSDSPSLLFGIMLINSMCYMPTIALSNTISYRILLENNLDVQKVFPPIRVWGTIGFICALWIVDLAGFSTSNFQFFMAAGAAICLSIFSLKLPACPPENKDTNKSFFNSLGLDAFVLFKRQKMAVFFIFSMLIGAVLQVSNMHADSFISSFGDNILHGTDYSSSFVVNHSKIIISFSQISETLFILTIPFFLRKFGIKIVMIFSILAWVLRFGFFGLFQNPNSTVDVSFLFFSMIVYGMAFDFFNISGSLFVEKEVTGKIRASAQGLFMMMTNGLGTIIGSIGSAFVLKSNIISTIKDKNIDHILYDWSNIWVVFTLYSLIILFSENMSNL
jgi:NHS family xanthosine MFS transporter